MSKTVKILDFENRTIILLGTAHISKESIEDAEKMIREHTPDVIAIELDKERYDSIQNAEAWKKLDIVKVLKEGKGFVMMANLILSSFQKRLGADVGVKPGDEMRSAIAVAQELSIPTAMVDRPIQTTLRRAWAKNSFWGKMKLLTVLFASIFEKEEISKEQIEQLKNSNEMDTLMLELAKELPTVKQVLIDERDEYLASHIWDTSGNKVLAVLGAGHLPGVEKYLQNIASGKATTDTSAIEVIPTKKIGTKFLGWIFPVLIVTLIVAGFFMGGIETSFEMLLRWFLWNGSLAALGTALALGHPLAILVGFIGAPLGTLNPFLAVGLFTGLTQAALKKPKIEDMESLQDSLSSIKSLYKNRISRVLLVFFLSSLGGAIGNFIAVPALVSSLFH